MKRHVGLLKQISLKAVPPNSDSMPQLIGGRISTFSALSKRGLRVWIPCLLLALHGCGGAGGGAGAASANSSSSGAQPTPPPTVPPPTVPPTAGPPTLRASATAVSATTSPAGLDPNLQVDLSLLNPPTNGVYYETRYAGTAVTSASILWQPTVVQGAQSGLLEIMLDPPAFMGSGTYHDTVTVLVCLDSKCLQQIAGSPISVAVTYTVTGNVVSDATYAILPTALALEVPSNGTAPTTSIQVTAYAVPPYGAYVYYTSQSGGPVASLSFKQTSANAEPYAYATGVLSVAMKPPASLGPGVYTDLITLSICYDTACTRPAVGSPFEIPVTYTVTASAGQQFQEQIVNENLTALAVDPTGSVLYGATAPSGLGAASVTSPQLVEINPTDGSVTTLLTLPAAISEIVPSADGAYLYLLTEGWSTIQLSPAIEVLRVNTANLAIDQTVPLTNVTLAPAQIAVSPVDSNTWSAAFPAQPNVWEVEVFDGSVARPNAWSVTSDVVYGNQAIWSADGTSLYVLDSNLNDVALSISGLGAGTLLQTGSAAQGGFDFGGNLQLAGGLLYTAGGQVLNPATDSLVGHYTFPLGVPAAALTIDTTNNRVFASYTATVDNAAEGTIESFNLANFSPVWIARLPAGTQPLRWGSNGLAWIALGPTAGQNVLYLISGTFVAP